MLGSCWAPAVPVHADKAPAIAAAMIAGFRID
jgi:hypothetical protein